MNNQILKFEVKVLQFKQGIARAPIPALGQETEPTQRTGMNRSLKQSVALAPAPVSVAQFKYQLMKMPEMQSYHVAVTATPHQPVRLHIKV